MASELTHTVDGWRTWRFTCDMCARTLWSALSRESGATDMARTNGWIVADPTLCPVCATVTAKLEPQQPRANRTRSNPQDPHPHRRVGKQDCGTTPFSSARIQRCA